MIIADNSSPLRWVPGWNFLPPFDLQEHVFQLWQGSALPDTLWTVLMGALVAVACAWLGCFLLLQGRALLGDAISHTVLLGIVLAVLLTGSTGGGALLLAAVITGGLTTALIEAIRGSSRIKEDAATGIVFTTLFALGVLLLSTLASKAHIDPQHALYGNLEFVPSTEKWSCLGLQAPAVVIQMAGLCLVLFTGLVTFYRQLLVVSFDPQLAASLGMHPGLVRFFLLAALCLTIVGGFSSVGAVLVVGLLIAPPATGFLLSQRLPGMLAWSAGCGAASSLVGFHVAYWLDVTAAGTMVCVSCLWFGLALLFAPREGIVSRLVRRVVLQLRTGHENLARLLLKLGAVPEGTPVSLRQLAAEGGRPLPRVAGIVQQLRWRGWVEFSAGGVRLSRRGLVHAVRLDRAHRLWEAYLVERVGIAHDHVHPTAEELEHLLDDQLVARLDDSLGHPGIDPHGAPIPRVPVSSDRPSVFALSRLVVGNRGRVVGWSPSVDSPLLKEPTAVRELQLPLGCQVEVTARDPGRETWTIDLEDGRRIETSHELADQILVELPPEAPDQIRVSRTENQPGGRRRPTQWPDEPVPLKLAHPLRARARSGLSKIGVPKGRETVRRRSARPAEPLLRAVTAQTLTCSRGQAEIFPAVSAIATPDYDQLLSNPARNLFPGRSLTPLPQLRSRCTWSQVHDCFPDTLRRTRVQRSVFAVALGLGVAISVCGCHPGSASNTAGGASAGGAPSAGKTRPAPSADLEAQIVAFCGACHAVPKPASFPRSAWHEEVNKGFNFYFESGRSDLTPPPMVHVVEWFASRAPRDLEFEIQPPIEDQPRVPFRLESLLSAGAAGQSNSAVASLAWRRTSPVGPGELLLCDMRAGGVRSLRPTEPGKSLRTLAQLKNPCHAETCDLDADGITDLVVADLGSFLPQDHAHGRVVWLRGLVEGGYTPIVIQDELGRVADVEPGDFDGDGDLDLLVAEFGWRKTGRVLLLENAGLQSGQPLFTRHVIDGRHGAIHVPTTDLDGDGRLDFVVLFSQEHETIDAFFNEGEFRFRRQTVFAGSDPAYGSTGIQLVDFDLDGDLDLLATNGDMFDTFYVKPYHGVRWLENVGQFPWREHLLIGMPGVHRALAGDLDGDGDLDVVASALIPESTAGRQVRPDFDAILWLEQSAPLEFTRHGLLKGHGRYPSLELADFDADGDLDIAFGAMREEDHTPTVGVFWNERNPSGSSPAGPDQDRQHGPN